MAGHTTISDAELAGLDRNKPGLSRDWQLKILLGAAVLLGGGGVGAALFNLVIQLGAIAMLAFNLGAAADFVRRGPRLLVWLVIATLALPILQTVPLPPAAWQALPGRELVQESLALVGKENSWFPVSVDSNRTLIAAISLLPCIAVIVLAHGMSDRRLGSVFSLLVWLGLANLAFGAVQLASGNSSGNLYPGGHVDVLYGTFANRNSTALFLVITFIAFLAAPARSRDAYSRGLRILVGTALALGVLLTQSRSGTALLGLVVILRLGQMLSRRIGRQDQAARKRLRLQMIAAALGLLVAGGVLASSQKLDQTFERFERLNDVRPQIWQDALASGSRFWPVGSGVSTFDEVFQVDESLEYLDSARAGRAHNDYLELLIESGVFGVLLALAWCFWFVRSGWRHVRADTTMLHYGALLSLIVILLQSITDYPLRNQALLCVAAFMVNVISNYTNDRVSGGRH